MKNIFNKFYSVIAKHPKSYCIILLTFIAVHIHFYSLGGKFITNDYRLWQFLDIELLRNQLLQSLWYLHMQPPLFNFFLGLVEKVSFGFTHIVYTLVYVGMGLGTALALFHLCLKFKIHPVIAIMSVISCLISPSWMLYEQWLMYTFPILALLTFAALQMHNFMSTGSTKHGIIFFMLLIVLVYLRSIFHWLWFLFVVAIVWTYFERKRMKVLTLAIVPFILVMALFAKNAYLFGSWSSSSWLGPNLYKMTRTVPNSTKRELLLKSRISNLSFVQPFLPVSTYEKFINSQPWGIPALDQSRKSDGDVNFNHHIYIKVNRRYLEESLAMIKAAPADYFNLVKQSWRRYCHPAWSYEFFIHQSNPYLNYVSNLNDWLFGWEENDFSKASNNTKEHPFGTYICWLVPLAFLFWIILMAAPSRFGKLTRADHAVLAFCVFNLLLVTFAAIFLLRYENFRLRFTLTPYYALLYALFLDRVFAFISTIQKQSAQSSTKGNGQ